jgi:5-methylcytosine-specific restriction endonuclease McrA
MASQQWFALRERWAEDWAARHGNEPHCRICGIEWALCDDLHHRTSERLGKEARQDLIPLCRSCHGALHRILESDRSWRRLNRAQATDLIVLNLRRKARKYIVRP